MASTRDVVVALADATSADARGTRRVETTATAGATTARRSHAGRASVVANANVRVDETMIGREAKGRARSSALASGKSVKRRRGRPPTRGGGRGAILQPTRAIADAATATAVHAAYLEMVMHRMMMYHARLAYDTMRRAAAEAQTRALLARESAHKEQPTEGPPAQQKQWPIVPQVSTAICPPRRDNSRSAPGAFGKREAVNAGVQQASAAKSKAANQRKAAEGTTSANEASRSSHDDPKAVTAKRMQEAKVLLDPSTALDRNALEHEANRRRRSGAPSPESSMQPPSDGADGLAGSVAHGSKGSEKESKSAALA